MNYQKIYDDICNRGQIRKLPKEIYTEKHHIVPKCLGGSNEKSNLTVLTAREHFICHLILARRLHPKNYKLWSALHKMMFCHNGLQQRYVPSSRIFEQIRIEIKNHFNSIGRYNLGKTWVELFGVERSNEMKSNLSKCMSNQICSDEKRLKCRMTHLGKPKSDSAKQNLSLARKGKLKNGDNPNAKRIKHMETGMIFKSQKEAAEYFKVTYACIFLRTKRGLFEIIGNNRKLLLNEH